MLRGTNGEVGCFTNAAEGPLTVDPKWGTAITDEGVNGGFTAPVMWPPRYTGRRVGSEVVVLDSRGNVVATTGRKYRIEGASDKNEMGQSGWVACGYVIQK
jgi:hypothetical protein